ncbi:cell surface protein [Streptococcus gallolyticus subsp. gallolyticus]|uniref:Cell surface protein n=2 Tax=Streptococcus gallolyticus TaxID=315405 RepID=A0AA36JXW4_STRG3|nr:GBS Bsp-like repeat-containing protein [Streptococcus gallolyticus]KJE99571.1 cell surface protein [Streptococcus gallolyticus subsp. gallolyticus]MCF1633202.1 GBS Bsp-like repeat-containing protein [Streptococcus gallolyticus]MCY7155182.1 GBS Bsp-like repeat-containing protein [Streptococcus gallolyticus subsp. gallolyticus]MCY7158923.1 GBS Bsp-like repeat-containing protein [Streptococcus gallolyticus subsp. gallolyticus]MCY7173937.1 GBS Bsp-like repeat-containing protein [Streptococcus g
MKQKGHGTIKKSKAYGAIGTLLLSGALIAALGTTNVSADETSVDTAATIETVVESSAVQGESDNETVEVESVDSDKTATVNDEQEVVSEYNQADVQEQTTTDENVESETAKDVSSESSQATTDTKVSDSEMAEQTEDEITDTQDSVQTDEQLATVEGSADNLTVERGATGNATNEVTSVSLASNGFNLQYNQAIASGAKIMFAVWSDVNGQDDLVWYTADSNGKATAKYTGSYGKYYVHTYQNLNGKMTGLNGTTIDVPKPSAKVSITKASATTYKVIVTDVPVYITSVTLPTWTENKGQDDIIWYKTTKDSTTTYSAAISVAEHNLESGKYNVHVYGTSAVTNSLTGLLGTSFQGDYAFGDVAVSASLGQKGINITIPSDVSKAITVYHAVWSAKNDQDDIVWYKVPSNGELTAKYTGDYGKYLIHTYGVVNGRMIGLNTTSIDVVNPSVSVDLTKVSETSVKVTISDVPAYMTSIVLPTWTENKGQDDIKWYQATKQSDGSYTYTFYAKNHNFESGHYNVHVYGTSAVTNSFIGLTATSGIDLTFSEKLTNPTVTVQNHNAANGTLQVVIAETETSKDIASVAVAAWSQAEQKNIHWYTTSSVVNGKVVVTVDEKYHHNISGDYTVHVYVKTTSGDTVGYALGSYALTKTQSTAKATTSYKGTGVYSVTISGVYSSGTVKYAVWSDTNGQDDIKWYDATTSGTTATGLINVANHSGTGTYHLHAYQSDNGQMYFLTSTDFTVKQTNYNTPYYNQRDGRWANTRYGYYTMASTGCVPTSLAMVFSALTNTEVLPTTVASYLYNNTVEFNRGTEGTTGNGILVASRQWGLTPTVINSSAALTSALKEGHHVVAAVQQDKFSPWGYGTSHEIVLKGYSNGNTYVSDPYNSANNGWYPIASLWNEQSTQSVDTRGLGNPFVKITDI